MIYKPFKDLSLSCLGMGNMRLPVQGGQPADCVACGACTGHCPQSIDVPGIMKELKELGEKQ